MSVFLEKIRYAANLNSNENGGFTTKCVTDYVNAFVNQKLVKNKKD